MSNAFRSLLLLAFLGLSLSLQAQMPTKNWQNESYSKDSVYGTGSDDALGLVKGMTSTPIVVAVIDGGVYIKHPALKNHLWVNKKEVAGNKKDDDKNGYIDDINGWDFIGGKDSDVKQDNEEVTRLYRVLNKKYANTTAENVAKGDKDEYAKYLKVAAAYKDKRGGYQDQINNLKAFSSDIDSMKIALGKTDLVKADLDNYTPADSELIKAKDRLNRNFDRYSMMIKGITADTVKKLVANGIKGLNDFLIYQYNLDFDPRFVVNDNYANASERVYGNNDVIGPTDVHGTHVSGIIGGDRNPKDTTGDHEGIADNVLIMTVRVVPDGDERDKDVANGIRYAVDNGAKVINMSFGKQFSWNKKTVDDAVKYAEAHDVLLIHAAGNDHKNNDSTDNFPNRTFEGTSNQAKNWLEVGASDVKGRPGRFSNYGKNTVDLFAPGVFIYSSVPDTGYAFFNGTSMASPCVAGVAALIREYFPKLSATEVKDVLMQSVTKIPFKVPMPGHPDNMVDYSDLCISGGVVNAYKAVQIAMQKSGIKVPDFTR